MGEHWFDGVPSHPSPGTWLNEHASGLEGLELDEAVALIESVGLQARVIHYPNGWMTQDLRHDRINPWLTQDGSVASIDAG